MSQPLRVLLVEDNPDDAQLISKELKRAGFEAVLRRVDTEAGFLEGLQSDFDFVLSDFSMPEFNGLRALELLKESGRELPFIIVSGSIGEDSAVEAMRRGADDYLLKDRLTRLGPAVQHALEQARLRKESHQAQVDLRTTHMQLRQLLENSPAVLFVLKVEGQKVAPYLMSENLTALLGFTVAEALSSEWWLGQIHPGDRDRTVASMAETLRQGTSTTEYRLRHKDGSWRWVEDKRRVIRDATNQPVEIVGVWADITESKRAEEVLLRASGQKFGRQKTRIVKDLVVIFGLGALAFAFFYYTDVLVAPLNNLVLKFRENIDDLFAPPLILVVGFIVFAYRRWKEAQTRFGESANIEDALRTLHGELEKRIQQRTAELSKANDSLRAEITERTLAERRLATQSGISRILADANTFGEATPKILEAICESEGWDFGAFWEVDVRRKELLCLEVWHRPEVAGEELAAMTRKLTFTSNAGFPGRVWAARKPLLVPEIAQAPNYSRGPLATKIGMQSAVAFPIILEGEVIGVVDFLGREIRATDGSMLEMFLSIGGQIGSFSKRLKLAEQFRQAQKLEGIGQLAGGVAHDFNNILAIIQMQADLLKASAGLSAEQAEYADEIGATAQRAAALTRQLLLFSRREVFQPRDLEMSESIVNTTKMLRRVLGEDIQVQLKLASQPLFIHADPGMLDQVLLNLAVNARDAMPKGGQLVIETSGVELDEFAAAQSAQARPGSFVCLSVSDSGCGIAPEILPRIFEPFFTTKDVGKGTGLGLATVFGVAQQHQGWATVYSEVGRGTTFHIYFPRLAQVAGVNLAQPAPVAAGSGDETILLVEDDPSLRISVRKILAGLGYRILEAPTGVKALEVWQQNRAEIKLLLTDLVMPDGMTGKELAERIHQDDAKMKVIYMSGYSAEVVGKDFPLKEGENFLSKPFPSSKLLHVVRQMLDVKS